MNQETRSYVRSMVCALSAIDEMMGFPERSARFKVNQTDPKVVFGLGMNHHFDSRERLETDIAMARFFGGSILVGTDGRLNQKVLDELRQHEYDVGNIVCVGDDVSSWVVVGKHFALEMKNAKFG